VDADAQAVPGGQYRVTVTGSQGVYVGDHGIQVNLFTGERPPGPVVAGSVPQPPPAFRPRPELLDRLRATGPGVPVARAVTGMRGVGKTQLAAAYARECIEAGWRLVAWVGAEDGPALLNGLAVVAARLGLERPGVALEAVGGEVRNRLEADGDRCLIVFDNVADPDQLRPYLPAAGHAQVIITSTDTRTETLGRPVPVDVFTPPESVGFLAERTGRAIADGAITIADPEGAAELADELGHLPLALAQAAAVIAAQRLRYPVYLSRLRAYPTEKYLTRPKGDPYPRGVAEAISLSIDAVTGDDPTGLTADLLGILALLSPQGVARDLLQCGPPAGLLVAPGAEAAQQRAAEGTTADGAAGIDAAIGRLADASLVTFGGDDTVLAHRLTMRVVRERALHEGGGFLLVAKACLLLDAARVALGEPWLNRARVRLFAQQVVALNEHVAASPGYGPTGPAEAEALTLRLLNLRLWALTFLNQARDAVTQAVAIAEPLLADAAAAYGPSHPATLSARTNLGAAYRAAGRVDDAITQYERVLADHERLSGRDHPETLTCRNNLGVAYRQAGRADQAIAMLERTVTERERVLGFDDRLTLQSSNNLANAYMSARRYREGLAQHARTLASRDRVFGSDHPDTLSSRVNLAAAILETGRPDEALPLLEHVVPDCERKLGDEHPDTLTARGHLANCHYAAGRLTESLAHYQKAVTGFERQLGPAHPLTVAARANLDRARREAATGTS